MIIPYYTGATKSVDQQPNPKISLGGYISTSKIPNGTKNNIFENITSQEVLKELREIKMIALHNNGETAKTNVKVWVDVDDEETIFIYKLDVVEPGYDTVCNKYYFEQINSSSELPYNAELEVYGPDNQFDVGSINPDRFVGVWISREIDESKLEALNFRFNTQNNQEMTDEYIEYLRNRVAFEEERFSLKFSYD